MAKDFYDKIKIWSEVLKNNWPMLILAFSALSSLSTNAAQYFAKVEVERDLANSQDQVAAVANHLTAIKIPKAAPKIVIPSCGDCIKRIEKLERWH